MSPHWYQAHQLLCYLYLSYLYHCLSYICHACRTWEKDDRDLENMQRNSESGGLSSHMENQGSTHGRGSMWTWLWRMSEVFHMYPWEGALQAGRTVWPKAWGKSVIQCSQNTGPGRSDVAYEEGGRSRDQISGASGARVKSLDDSLG